MLLKGTYLIKQPSYRYNLFHNHKTITSKKAAKSFALLAIVYLFATCSESEQIFPQLDEEGFKNSEPKTVTVPFKASFIGEYTSVEIPPLYEECDDSFVCKVGVDYVGTATHLGKFTGSFEFCSCGLENPYHPDGAAYGPAMTIMTAANSDELWLQGEGFVNVTQPEDNQPEYVASWWKDLFVITGGTGRFEGATGQGMTNDYNHYDYAGNSFHNWTGTITLITGKKNKSPEILKQINKPFFGGFFII